MPDRQKLAAAAEAVAAAIGARDLPALGALLAPGFTHRMHGGEVSGRDKFLAAVAASPGEIVFVRLEDLRIDVTPTGALVTGFQRAQVKMDGRTVDDRRGFIDWFVEVNGDWKIQAAVDLPA